MSNIDPIAGVNLQPVASVSSPGVQAAASSRTEPQAKKTSDYVNPTATDAELKKEGYSQADIKGLKRTGRVRCETCASRQYIDDSSDSGVSFKTPTKLTPGQAATAVVSHENEHVARNAAKADQNGQEVVQSNVRVFSSVCPECGKSYISGGETMTTTRNKAQAQTFADKNAENGADYGVGNNVDKRVG